MATSMNIAGLEASISSAQCRIETLQRDIKYCQGQKGESWKNMIKKHREEIARLREQIKRDKERLKELKRKK